MEASPSPKQARPSLDMLAGRVAFITGGSSGIGLGIAEACAMSDMKVAITYRTPGHLETARNRLNRLDADWIAIETDVTDRSAVASAADQAEAAFGHVNLLCSNAGVGVNTPISQATFEDWDYAVSVNLGGIVNSTHIFLQRMLAHQEPAHIVATSSMSGLFHGAQAGVYTTTKFAVVGMMEALRGELIADNIGVSAFCPGFVRSKIYLSDRNRPPALSNAKLEPPCDNEARAARAALFMADGMDPLECGRKVLAGVLRNDMYILTHPEYREGLEQRFRAILAHFPLPNDVIPPRRLAAEAPVLKHAVYQVEPKPRSDASDGPARGSSDP